jgi:hypothetical protein
MDSSDVKPQAHPDLAIDAGHGPKHVTLDEWNTSLARIAVLYPEKVIPADREARELVQRLEHDPETRRLVAALAVQTRATLPARPLRAARARSPRSRPRSRRRGGVGSTREGPSHEPEPPLGRPLTCAERRHLKTCVDQARRAQLVRLDSWRLCPRCRQEQEPEEFGNGCSYCRSCESERVSAAHLRRRLVAA